MAQKDTFHVMQAPNGPFKSIDKWAILELVIITLPEAVGSIPKWPIFPLIS